MKKIKDFSNVDLSVYKLNSKCVWVSPDLLVDENGNYVEVKPSAANSIAHKVGLKDFKSATTLYSNNPNAWSIFNAPFLPSSDFDDTADLCFTNSKGTVIYSLIDGIDIETDELSKMYEMFSDRNITTVEVNNNGKVAFLSIDFDPLSTKELDDDVQLVVTFYPELRSIVAFATTTKSTPIKNIRSAVLLYDGMLVGTRNSFFLGAIDPGTYSFDLFSETQQEPNPEFMNHLSLKEIIEALRVTQGTKHLAIDGPECAAIYLERLGKIDDKTTLAVNRMYDDLGLYKFYYDVTKTDVDDISLIHDRMKDIKPHLYFSKNIRHIDMIQYVQQIFKAEYDRLIDAYSENENYDIKNFEEIFKYVVELNKKYDFDEDKIKNYYVAN